MLTRQQEDLYTTKLDKGKSRISEAEADRLAKEIMRGAQSGGGSAVAYNAHLAEERGMEVDDSGVRQGQPLAPLSNQRCYGHSSYLLSLPPLATCLLQNLPCSNM